MKRILLVIGIIVAAQYCRAEVGVGIGWPYAAVKYNISDRTAVEGKYATGSGVNVAAGRFYWNFSKYEKLNLFTGLEGGYVNFDTMDMSGSGYEGALLLGGEYFITKRTSLMLDFSPTIIGLKSDDYKVSGLEFVINSAVYFYF